MSDLKGRVALVTGAARGIGSATAKALAAKGAKVLVTDLLDGAETASAVGGAFVKHDVTSEDDWIAAVAEARKQFGGLDILVNNAGVFVIAPIVAMTLEDFRRVQQINVEGVFLGMKHAIPAIAERAQQWDGGGSIVNLSSVAGINGSALVSAYCASKGAVRLMTKAAALEVAAMKIRINSVHPGIIDTPLIAAQDAGITQGVVDATPMGRLGTAREIAYGALFLASDESSYMTGAELVIDGGYTTP